MGDTVGSFDCLSDEARRIAMELRRLRIGIIADPERGELHLVNRSGRVTPELLARVRPVVGELAALIGRAGQRAR